LWRAAAAPGRAAAGDDASAQNESRAAEGPSARLIQHDAQLTAERRV